MKRIFSGVLLVILLTCMMYSALIDRSIIDADNRDRYPFMNQLGTSDEEIDLAVLVTTMGNITIELFGDMPITSGNFRNLTQFGIYDGTLFHRVIPDFVIQGGDATSKGIIVPSIPDELPNKHGNLRGYVAMAKTDEPNSARDQFYINLNNNSHLDPYYSVFGRVVAGLDVVDCISEVPTDEYNRPLQNVTILKAIDQSIIEKPELFVNETWNYTYRRYDGSNVEESSWEKVVVDLEEWDGQSIYLITDEFLSNGETNVKITTWRTTNWIDLKSLREYESKTTEVIYDPGYKNYEFPLYVGKEWTNSANVSWTTTFSDNSVQNGSYILEEHLTVVGEEIVTSPAGNFRTFKIKDEYITSGLEGYVDYIWFGSEAKNWVRWESYYNDTLREDALIKDIAVIPEFPSFVILPAFMALTLLVVIVYRRRHRIRSIDRKETYS